MPVSCPANIRETKIAFGFIAQADLATKNTDAELWSLSKVNNALSNVEPVTEDDANDIGKGDEFPSTVYPSHMNVTATLEKYASSEFAAWVFAFGLGQVTTAVAGTGGTTYTCVPQDPAIHCLNLPPFTMVEKIRDDAEAVVDRALIGMVVNDFTITMESGPGRANTRIVANLVGTGNIEAPTDSEVPPLTPEHALNAASAKITVQGVDYVQAQSFMSLEVAWNNNVRVDTGIYPGSGVNANNFAVRGRMEYGDRTCTVRFVARAAKGSVEYQALMNQTEGPAVIELQGALIDGTVHHGLKLTFPRTRMSAVTNPEANGLVTVDVQLRILKHATQPYVIFEATTEKPDIEVLTSETVEAVAA